MTTDRYSGDAIVYCEGALGTTSGKTAHGLIRLSRRFRILSVVDSRHAGRDAGDVIDGAPCGIPVHGNIEAAVGRSGLYTTAPTHLVVGLAPDGGRLPALARRDVARALQFGLSVVSGLHDWLSEDPWLAAMARENGASILDIRKPPLRKDLHFFSGKIEEVNASRFAVLGTDSAVGKRTTAWLLVDALKGRGISTELVGTGQTAWLQGARYGIVMDAIVNDFVSGEIEHATWRAWKETGAAAIVLEGQGSLLNPAYPGGFEILAAGRPQAVILQHAPGRREYDGFPGWALHPLEVQIRAVEIVSQKPVVAVTISHEGLSPEQVREACARITLETGLPAVDPLRDGLDPVLEALRPHLEERGASPDVEPTVGEAPEEGATGRGGPAVRGDTWRTGTHSTS